MPDFATAFDADLQIFGCSRLTLVSGSPYAERLSRNQDSYSAIQRHTGDRIVAIGNQDAAACLEIIC
jgi:hypothetical protein